MKKNMVLLILIYAMQFGFTDIGWDGKWYRNNLHSSAEITIQSSDNNTFSFEMDAFSGANMGHIKGTAVISGNQASTHLEVYDVKSDLYFTLKKDTIDIATENCEYYGGNSVYFDGTYSNAKASEEDLAFKYLVRLLNNQPLVEKIQAITGDKFSTIAYCLHVVNEETCHDSFPATVLHGCVQGVCPYMQAIIMYTPDNQFYIACHDDDHIYYFTSDTSRKKTPPKTILEWKQEFPDISFTLQK